MANCNECKRQDDCPGLNYCVHEPREMRAELRAAIAAAVAAERERCAQIADDHDPSSDVSSCDTAEQIAAKIRGA